MDPFTFAIVTGLIVGVGSYGLAYAFDHSKTIREWVQRTFLGLDFLVVGAGEVGKTSFYNFLKYDWYADNSPILSTVEISDKMSFKVSKGGELEFQIKSAFDIPGQLSPEKQVEQICDRAPEVLMVFLASRDDKKDTENEKYAFIWLRQFLTFLSDAILTHQKLRDNLKCMTIVLNKIDLIDDDEKKTDLDEIKNLVDEILKPVLGKNVRLIDIYPCTLLKENGGEKAAKLIVLSIVEAIKLKQRLVRK